LFDDGRTGDVSEIIEAGIVPRRYPEPADSGLESDSRRKSAAYTWVLDGAGAMR
jgi:hypothetical protein